MFSSALAHLLPGRSIYPCRPQQACKIMWQWQKHCQTGKRKYITNTVLYFKSESLCWRPRGEGWPPGTWLSALRCLCLQYKPKEQLTIHLMRQDCKKLGRDAWGTSSSCALELWRINHSGKQQSSGMNLKAVPEQCSEVCWRRFCCHQHSPGDSTLCYGMHNIAPCE